jgi:predicted dehydrogenase
MVSAHGDAPAGAADWRELRALVVGCGSIGKRHARVLRQIGVKTLYACDPVAAQLEAAARETRFDATVESFEAGLALHPDAVFLCTPPALHVAQATKAIEAGCHVFSEKPLSVDLEGIPELERLVARSGRVMMVGLCFRYHRGLLKAREAVTSGRIGRIVSIRALMGEHLPDIRPDYRELYLAKYNGAFELMHDIDLAIWFSGQGVKKVMSVNGVFSDIGIQAPDLVEILMEMDGRCVASVHLDFFQLPRRRQIELIGTRGTITVEFAAWDTCTISIFDAESRAWAVETLATERDDMFRDEDGEFLRAAAEPRIAGAAAGAAAAEGPLVQNTIAEGVKSLAVVLEAQRALKGEKEGSR